MKLRTIKRVLVEYMVNHFLTGTKFFALKRKLLCSIGYEIGENTKIVGPIMNTGHISVGRNCWVGRNLTVHGNGSVIIGDNCDIAPDVMFLTGGHRIGDAARRAGQGETYTITVGNGVWIGARSTMMKNISVGDGVVVAACACVTADVPENMVVGGVPARVIKELEDGPAEHFQE